MRKPIECRLYHFLDIILKQIEHSEDWLKANKEELHVSTPFEFLLTLVTNVKLNVTLNNNGAGYSKVVFFFLCWGSYHALN